MQRFADVQWTLSTLSCVHIWTNTLSHALYGTSSQLSVQTFYNLIKMLSSSQLSLRNSALPMCVLLQTVKRCTMYIIHRSLITALFLHAEHLGPRAPVKGRSGVQMIQLCFPSAPAWNCSAFPVKGSNCSAFPVKGRSAQCTLHSAQCTAPLTDDWIEASHSNWRLSQVSGSPIGFPNHHPACPQLVAFEHLHVSFRSL